MQPDDIALAQRTRELQLVYQIDRLRDSVQEESAFLAEVTTVLLSELRADLCLITLSVQPGGEPALRSIVDRRSLSPSAIDTLRREANALPATHVLSELPSLPGLQLIAAPLILNGERLGALVLGRMQPFAQSDERLLNAAVSQVDSAIIHLRSLHELQQRNRELELIYRIDRIRDQELDFDAMLQRVLSVLCGALNSEIGFIALYDEAQETRLQLKVTADSAPITAAHYDAIMELSQRAITAAQPIFSNTPLGDVRSMAAVPLILREKVIGVVGALDSKRPRGFSPDDQRLLSALTSQIDTAIFERKEIRRLRRLLARAVDPKVLEQLLDRADASLLLGERVELTALFADLRDSTAWAETTDPDALIYSLNTFYNRMTEIIFRFGGTLDKYAGDQIIALFGTPLPMADHAVRAARAAVAMQQEHRILQAELAARGYQLPALGIGVNSGTATAGEFGAHSRTQFSAIGPAINLCSRLCGTAEAGEILIHETTYAALASALPAEELPPLTLKGIARPIHAYRLIYSDR